MKWLTSVVIFLGGLPLAEAADPQAVVQTALALSKAKALSQAQAAPQTVPDGFFDPKPALKDCGCSGPGNCTCKPGMCECAACAWTAATWEHARLGRAPVALWVGQRPAKVAGVAGYTATSDDAHTPSPGMILVRPDQGELIVVKRFPGTPTPEEILAALIPQPQEVPAYYQQPPVYFQPISQPAFVGCFGGGSRGGG